MPAQPSFFARLWLATVCWFKIVFDAQFAARVLAVREDGRLPQATQQSLGGDTKAPSAAIMSPNDSRGGAADAELRRPGEFFARRCAALRTKRGTFLAGVHSALPASEVVTQWNKSAPSPIASAC